MNQNRVAENFIPELTDVNALMKAILNEKKLTEFRQEYSNYEREYEHESMAVWHNAQILMKAQLKYNYNENQKTFGLIKEPKPQKNLKDIVSNYIQKIESEKILSILKEKQNVKIRLIYNKKTR